MIATMPISTAILLVGELVLLAFALTELARYLVEWWTSDLDAEP